MVNYHYGPIIDMNNLIGAMIFSYPKKNSLLRKIPSHKKPINIFDDNLKPTDLNMLNN